MNFCLYYQAKVKKEETWFCVAILRSFENVVFDRTMDHKLGIFEFFVPEDRNEIFLHVMKRLQSMEVISDLKSLSNRLRDKNQDV